MKKDIFQKSSKSVGCKYMNIITRSQLRLRPMTTLDLDFTR